MNYRMYTDRDMNEQNMNMSMVEDITMENDNNKMQVKGVHMHEMPTNETMGVQDMVPMFGALAEDMSPMYGNMPVEGIEGENMGDMDYMDNMEDVEGMEDMEDMDYMDNMRPGGEPMYMENMMPCCMMNNMGVMPYMVELEEDEEDEKCGDDVDDIVKAIEKHHPEILTVLSAYGIPYPIANKIVKRIVHLTLKYK